MLTYAIKFGLPEITHKYKETGVLVTKMILNNLPRNLLDGFIWLRREPSGIIL
jgi:hypothetical protein